jgi:hypothetical protein
MSREPFRSRVISLSRIMIPTIESDHQWIHQGRAYTAEHEFTTTDAVAVYMHLVPTQAVHLNGVRLITNTNDFLVELLEDPVMSLNASPAEVPIRNNNRYHDDDGLIDIYSNSSYVSGGIALCGHHLYGEAATGGQRSPVGADGAGPWEWVLRHDKEYAFKISRPGQTGAGKCAIELSLYEG